MGNLSLCFAFFFRAFLFLGGSLLCLRIVLCGKIDKDFVDSKNVRLAGCLVGLLSELKYGKLTWVTYFAEFCRCQWC